MRPDEAAGSLDPKLAAATTAAPPATVKMKGIRKNFGAVRALQGVDLDLMPREILGLVGDNAAGKSTLMKILSGALRADAGEMFVEGRPAPIHSPRDARNLGIEMVHQDFALCKNIPAYPPSSASFSIVYGIGTVRTPAQVRRGIMAARSYLRLKRYWYSAR